MTRNEYFMMYDKNIFFKDIIEFIKHPFHAFKRRK